MGDLLEKFKSWFDDPENVRKWEEDIRKSMDREDRYINKLANLSTEQRSNFIQKCINKYESDEYRNKEYSKGYEPRCPLYDVILKYAEIYGTDCWEDEMFLTERFKIDNMWIIELYQGQGSFINIYKDNDIT